MLSLRTALCPDETRQVIAYKSSELRAVELLDGLCSSVSSYALVSPSGKKTKYW
jgi:hypothetical protein